MRIFIFILTILFLEFLFAQDGGSALNFDGSNDLVDCGTDSSLNIQDELTIEAWIKGGASQTTYARIVDKYNFFQHQGFNLVRFPRPNSVMLDFYATDDTKHTHGGAKHIFDEKWHYVAATFDGNDVKIYVDGILENSIALPDQKTIQLCSYPLMIGNGFDGGTWFPFAGSIDEVRLWNIAIDSVTIKDWMHKKISTNHPDISNLVGYWKFDEGEGSFANDSSGLENHGVLINMDTTACWLISHIPLAGNYVNDLNNISATWSSVDSSYSSILSIKSSDVTGDTCIIFGHDNENLAWSSSDIPGNLDILYRLARIWQMEVYGNLSASIIFDVSELYFSDGYSFKLLKDSDGTFTDADTVHGIYDSVNQLFIVPNQIFQHGYYYTLGTQEDVTAIRSDIQKLKVKEFALFQNYPNPFNPVTNISWQLAVSTEVELSIYNILGQKVCTLLSEKQDAGKHNLSWDANGFMSGVYFCRLQAGQYQDVQKMILLK